MNIVASGRKHGYEKYSGGNRQSLHPACRVSYNKRVRLRAVFKSFGSICLLVTFQIETQCSNADITSAMHCDITYTFLQG